MKKLRVLSILCFLSIQLFAQKTENIKIYGKVKEEKTVDGLIGACIKFLKNGEQHYVAMTNFEGNFELNISEGKYDIEISYIGYKKLQFNNLQFNKENNLALNFTFKKEDEMTENCILLEYKPTLYSAYNMTSGAIYSNEVISNLPR